MPAEHEVRLRELQETAYRSVLVCFLQEEFDLNKEMILAELRKALQISDEKAEELMENVMQGDTQSVRTELTADVICKLEEVSGSCLEAALEGTASNILTELAALTSPSVQDDWKPKA